MAPLGVVIEDVESVRTGLAKVLEDAGCKPVLALSNSGELLSLLRKSKKKPAQETVIVVSDLMDSKEAAKYRSFKRVIGVGEDRVKELAKAKNLAPAINILIYSLAPTLAMAAKRSDGNSEKTELYRKLLDNVKSKLDVDDKQIVGKVDGSKGFVESQHEVADWVQGIVAEK